MQVIASLCTKFGGAGYTWVPISRVQDYSVDSAIDTDADQFSITIGDPKAELVDLLSRDSEVRVKLSAAIKGGQLVPLLSGYADTIGLTHDGVLSLSGRDLTAAAIDDTAEPHKWLNYNPTKIIRTQGSQRGFTSFNMATMAPYRVVFTDGSESVWAFWYRMVRTRKMWIWVDSIGTLNVSHLNYGSKVSYYLGYPNANTAGMPWIDVISGSVQKDTTNRVARVWVFGDNGRINIKPVKKEDPSMVDWIKRPLNIVAGDASINTRIKAVKEADEQIFEGMVGELEYTIQITDPGYIIQQNKIALVNLPQMGIDNKEFFIVGVQLMGSQDGFVQQIRLREKWYALTRRSPQIISEGTPDNFSTGLVGGQLQLPNHADWGVFFVNAANKYHDPLDVKQFLQILLAISMQESTIRNVREPSGGPDYYTPQNQRPDTIITWKRAFANEPSNQYNEYHKQLGVGPMQLTDQSLKDEADALGGSHDEFVGGRWNPEMNIMIGAKYLSSCINSFPGSDPNRIQLGIAAYNTGVANANTSFGQKYAREVQSHMDAAGQLVQAGFQNQGGLVSGSTFVPTKIDGMPYNLAKNVPDALRKMVGFAIHQLGVPYVSGGDTRAGYDCSGLVWAIYNSAGLGDQIGGRQSTFTYWNNGKEHGQLVPVPQDQFLPGDMIFYNGMSNGSVEYAGHMAFYMGGGKIIVAPSTGQLVQYQGINEPANIDPNNIPLGGMRLRGLWPQSVLESAQYDGLDKFLGEVGNAFDSIFAGTAPSLQGS